jgi:acyl carrier protein
MTEEAKIIALVAEQLGVPVEKVTRDTTLESLGVDSLDRIEIVMKLEEEFSVQINDRDAESFMTVGNIIDYMDQQKK